MDGAHIFVDHAARSFSFCFGWRKPRCEPRRRGGMLHDRRMADGQHGAKDFSALLKSSDENGGGAEGGTPAGGRLDSAKGARSARQFSPKEGGRRFRSPEK